VSDTRLARLADVLVGYSAGVKPGELVLLEAPVIVEPLLD
jgi:leucyl aminopeptidase (aminopeptidase T)